MRTTTQAESFPASIEETPDGKLPISIEAEQQVIGALLTNNENLSRLPPEFGLQHFQDPFHGRLFAAIKEKIEAGTIATPVTMKADFQNDPSLAQLGGPAYLARMAGVAISAFAIADYARTLIELHERRNLIIGARAAIAAVLIDGRPAAKVGLELEAVAGAVSEKSAAKHLTQSHLANLTKAVTDMNAAYQGVGSIGATTGIPGLDKKLNGLRPGSFYLLAGRASMGKSSVGQHIALAVAEANGGVLYASLEMTGADMAARAISSGLMRTRGVRVPYFDMQAGNMTEEQFRQVIEETKRQEALPFRTGERECRDMPTLRSAIRRSLKAWGDKIELKLVVIDYVQQLTGKGFRSVYDRVSEASDFCKQVAMDFNVPVLALSQLSREVERRDPPVPMMSDLRESGKLEEDADVVMLLYRSGYYLSKKIEAHNGENMDELNELRLAYDRTKFDLDILIPKHRGGPTGSVNAYMDPAIGVVSTSRPREDQGELLI